MHQPATGYIGPAITVPAIISTRGWLLASYNYTPFFLFPRRREDKKSTNRSRSSKQYVSSGYAILNLVFPDPIKSLLVSFPRFFFFVCPRHRNFQNKRAPERREKLFKAALPRFLKRRSTFPGVLLVANCN